MRPPAGDTGPVRLKKAQLLLAWWGSTEEVPLRHRYVAGELIVTVPLHGGVLSALDEAPPPDFAYVYLEFDGFAPVRSEQFHWLGSTERPDPPGEWKKVTAVKFRFRGGPTVSIRDGERREVSLQVRRPISKQVRFVDERGLPFTDITVDGGAFWSMENHCGRPSGLIPLFAERRPDADGVVPVPDGDVEYGFRVDGNLHASIIGGEDHDPTFLTTFIDKPKLLVRIRRPPRVAPERAPVNCRQTGPPCPRWGIRGWGGIEPNRTFGPHQQARGGPRAPISTRRNQRGLHSGIKRHPVWKVGNPKRGHFPNHLPGGTKFGELPFFSRPNSPGKKP